MSFKSLRSIGPAIIVASVVLGPGSILTSSKTGCTFGYNMLWLVALTTLLMIGMTALAARTGVSLERSPCDELAGRGGRPLAALIGLVLFGIVACFQFGNNAAVIAALQPYCGDGDLWPWLVLGGINLTVLIILFAQSRLYKRIELLMKILIGVMVLGFVGNLFFARPDFAAVGQGLIPNLPEGLEPSLLPKRSEDGVEDPLMPIQALIGTSFSIAGAFYTAYLVRDRGWTKDKLGRSQLDSVVGICVLGLLSMTIMVTAAAVLHGKVEASELGSVDDLARQLRPLFGGTATVLFSLGILAGALSSFLVNAMIGGAMLSDGLGLGSSMNAQSPRICTALALLIGMGVAIAMQRSGEPPLRLIYFAQALTVIGNPLLAAVLLWFARRVEAPLWMKFLAWIGFALVSVIALRVGVTLYLG